MINYSPFKNKIFITKKFIFSKFFKNVFFKKFFKFFSEFFHFFIKNSLQKEGKKRDFLERDKVAKDLKQEYLDKAAWCSVGLSYHSQKQIDASSLEKQNRFLGKMNFFQNQINELVNTQNLSV